MGYPLVNIQTTMENHHFSWVNQRTKWQCLTAMTSYVKLPEGTLKDCWRIRPSDDHAFFHEHQWGFAMG